jgi:hypothetical protein
MLLECGNSKVRNLLKKKNVARNKERENSRQRETKRITTKRKASGGE